MRPRRRHAARRVGLPASRRGVSSNRARLRVPWTTCGCGESGPPALVNAGGVALRTTGWSPVALLPQAGGGLSWDLTRLQVLHQGRILRLSHPRAEQVPPVRLEE